MKAPSDLGAFKADRRVCMETEFKVQMTAGMLYDYMLHHTYTSFSGIIGTFIGFLILVNFFMTKAPIYLIAGLVVTFYLPCSLYLRAKKQMLSVPGFLAPIHYKFTDEGMEISQGEECQIHSWDTMLKAVSTSKSVILYTSKTHAFIFPRRELAEYMPNIISMISTHMDAKKVNIRG